MKCAHFRGGGAGRVFGWGLWRVSQGSKEARSCRAIDQPCAAYRLGNRSALEWVLERHKESTPKDPTIREKFNTYRFADHKERVVDLLARVTTVSVETVRVLAQMPAETV